MSPPSTPGTDRPFARLLTGALALALVGGAGQALAQPSPSEVALAEALFQEGKRLMDEKRYPDACAKLAESQRLDPASGTLLRLALCHELEGKTATAWAELQASLSAARKDGRHDRVAMAQEALDRVTPRLSRLSVVVPAPLASTPGLLVRRDGVDLAPASWGVSAPVDPGDHSIEVSAPGFSTSQIKVTVGPAGDRREVSLPPLAPLPAPAAAPSAASSGLLPAAPPGSSGSSAASSGSPASAPTAPPAADRSPMEAPSGSGARMAGFVLGGAGLVAIGVGGYFGVTAIKKHNDAASRCPASPCSDRGGVDLNEEAKRAATVANVAVGVGLLAAGVGVFLVLSSPSRPETSLRLSPQVGKSQAGLSLSAGW